MVPLTVYRTAIIWFPHIWSNPHTLFGIGIWWSSHTLYGTGIVWSPNLYVWSLHIWSVFMSYMTYGPQYLIWNRYHMVPHMYIWSPLPYMEQLSYGPPHVHIVPTHVKWPSYLIWNRYHMKTFYKSSIENASNYVLWKFSLHCVYILWRSRLWSLL